MRQPHLILIQGVGTNGWAVDRGGFAVFQDAYVRDSDVDGCDIFGSSIYLPGKSDPDIAITPDDGISIKRSSSFTTERAINFFATDISDVQGRIWLIDPTNQLKIEAMTGLNISSDINLSLNASNFININGDNGIEMASLGHLTISTVPGAGTGELRFRVNTTEGMNIQGLPTSNPGGSNNVWRDGTTLRIT